MKKIITLIAIASMALIGWAAIAHSADRPPTGPPPTSGMVEVVGPDGETLRDSRGRPIKVDLDRRKELPTNASDIARAAREKNQGKIKPEAENHKDK